MFTSKSNSITIKRDTIENWQKAINYIPSMNTIIIVDMPDNTIQLKIGDNSTKVADLINVLQSAQVDTPLSTSTVEDGVLTL